MRMVFGWVEKNKRPFFCVLVAISLIEVIILTFVVTREHRLMELWNNKIG